MTNLILLLVLSVFLLITSVILFVVIQRSRNKESKLKLKLRDGMIGMARKGHFKSVLDVAKFNDWFNKPKPKEVYAHPGIFLRTDKLSMSHIEDYITDESDAMLMGDDFEYAELVDFEDRIRLDWMKKQSEPQEPKCICEQPGVTGFCHIHKTDWL